MNYLVLMILIIVASGIVFKMTTRTESFKGMNFTQLPINETYVFATPIPADASEFDKLLGRYTDAHIPAAIMKGTGTPEPSPYTDSEVQKIAEAALSKVKTTTTLRYISTDFATKTVDAQKNTQFDIAFLAYDVLKNFSVKLALVALVTKNGVMYIKTFKSFNRKDNDPSAPRGTNEFRGLNGEFVNDLGIDYVKLYG